EAAMIRMSLSEAARVLDAKHLGRDAEFAGVSTDSRALQRDNLFVALHGPHFDGHAFLTQAMQQGAAAVLVDRPVETALPGLRVQDTRIGLGQLAAAWRARHTMPLVAVTGSNGKTTVKEMIAAILGQRGPLLVTQGNLNNDIGVPLTILRLESAHRHAVIEMGANHPGEISTLTRIARPTVALITNAGPAHLEGFGSIEGVARAKGEIYQGLSESGIAVVNADDAYAQLWRELAGAHRMMTFGLKNPSDVRAEWQAEAGGNSLQLITPVGAIEVKLPLPGRHNVMNALAAAAAALAAGAALADIKNGLEAMRPVHGRLQRTPGIKSAELIDDTYNANPASLQAALDVLAACATRKWLVLGDMGELGGDAALLHEQAGEKARAAGVEALYATGELSRHAVHKFGAGAEHFSDHVQLIAALTKKLEHENDGVTILIKGSRSARMEDVVAALCRPAGATV
ncbi:MAG: UDP-N-acetylmuramoyl-tripeptide--D-alanyl-D-alanine ligase, partial [Gammaproteobacteria bacterium]